MDDEYVKIPREVNPACKLPDDLDVNVWRYMDFYKFESLLQQSALYLRRVDLLEDEFEGTYPREQLASQDGWFKSIGHEKLVEMERQNRGRVRKQIYVNCWCVGKIDLDLMWKAYIKKHPGLAVKSTVRSLQQVCDTGVDLWPLDVSLVQYIDHTGRDLINSPGLEVFLRKDIHFHLDNELRIVHRSTKLQPVSDYVWLPVILSNLITSVVLAPRTPTKDVTRVKDLLKKAGLKETLAEFSRNDRDLFE